MRIPRIYHQGPLGLAQSVVLHSDAAKHVSVVLRLSVKQQIILFNGLTNTEYFAEIINKDKHKIIVKILTEKKVHTQSGLTIHLVQSVCRNDKMDWVIQKATELGVAEITPVITGHCSFTSLKKIQAKISHWQKISISSCEQSGRCDLPKIHECLLFNVFLNNISVNHQYLFLDVPQDSMPVSQWSFLTHLTKLTHEKKPVYYLLIGPEGGFSPAERQQAQYYTEKCSNFHRITLGHRILRTETAGIVAMSALQTLAGDFR